MEDSSMAWERINKVVLEFDLDKLLEREIVEKGNAQKISDILRSKKIRDEYMKEYADDEMGMNMNPDVTLYDLFEGMRKHHEPEMVYGVYDSVIRERVLDMLAECMHIPYMVIYELWRMY